MPPVRCLVAAVLLVGGTYAALAQSGEPIDIKTGITDLLASPTGTVGYRYFDGREQVLGYKWQGFDEASGVYFVPEAGDDGRPQVFMHCPWRGGAGVATFDVALRLPSVPRIRLAFDIALRATARGSDGVTYRVLADGEELFAEHCTAREWETHEVDLSPYAGKLVTLRLEVGPGPAQNTTDDWSLWSNVRLLAGTGEQIAQALAKQREEREAERRRMLEQAAAEAALDLAGATTHRSTSVRPSVLGQCANSVRREKGVFVFACHATDEAITYRFDPAAGLAGGLTVEVDGKALAPTPFLGGPLVCFGDQALQLGSRALATELVSAEATPEGARLRYGFAERKGKGRAVLELVLSAHGKSLTIEAKRLEGTFGGFAWRLEGVREVASPFAPAAVGWAPGNGPYVSVVTDWTTTSATVTSGSGTVYTPLTDGRRNDLYDVFHLTVSRHFPEVLPNIPNPPSPFLDELSRRVVLDMWDGTFANHEQWLRDMARYGVDSFLIINHVWQRDGYDHSYPNTMPANAALGGEEDLNRLARTAMSLGHRFNVHENYYDYYPNAEAFREADCALDPQGNEIPGWDNGQVRAVILKPSKLMDYAREFSPQIRERYGCNSAYHDIMPTWNVDYDARVPNAGMIRVTRDTSRQLFEFDRKLYGGPVVCEAVHAEQSGDYDGGCNHGIDTYRTPVAVAYEVLKVHPVMSNHGFGYYERWLPWGYGPGWNTYLMTERERDKYRATQIAFGRTGFIGQQLMQSPHAVVKEYYLMQAFGRAYTGQLARRIRYATKEGAWLDVGAAAVLGELGRLEVEYEGGQRVWVNLSGEPWRIGGRTLPPSSAATEGPRAKAATALVDGQIADFAAYEGTLYADARSDTYLPPEPPKPIRPSVALLKWVGQDQFDLQMQWDVQRMPERDFTVFAHFVDPSRGGITFQTDHAPPKPTSTWQPGETVQDEVVRMTIPESAEAQAYDIMTGLYDANGRAALVYGATGMRVGRLAIQRENGRIVGVQLEAAPPAAAERLSDPEPYRQGLNATRKVLDFGEVATNGAVIIRRTPAGRELIAVPLGAEFEVGLAGERLTVTSIGEDGKALPAPGMQRREGKSWFRTAREAVRYEIR